MGQHAFADTILNSDQAGLRDLISELTNTDKICVLSSEEFCYLPLNALAEFKSFLHDTDVSIIYYARNCLTTLHPWWQEQVKHGSSQTFLEFILGCLAHPGSIHLLAPDAMLSNWAGAFGRDAIKIYLYDEISDVATQFSVDILNFRPPQDHPTETNISYNYIATEMMRFWNSLGTRGAELIQLPMSHKLRIDITEKSRSFSSKFSLSYRIPSFALIEETLLARWRGQIVGAVEPHIFKTREFSYPYVHPDFWLVNSDLAERMRTLAFEESVEHG
ncbi:hypothetical protein [Methylobacterium pseudosasicola]|uniref:hypothetical protein n=1 Tax=Methylobacterium pseudosasicola TaxID=582667 RepID=UPI00111357B8|nr:hypothetical protein [Methylobacterium pseudosasicola]